MTYRPILLLIAALILGICGFGILDGRAAEFARIGFFVTTILFVATFGETDTSRRHSRLHRGRQH